MTNISIAMTSEGIPTLQNFFTHFYQAEHTLRPFFYRHTGNYEAHECKIEISLLNPEDAGEWSCELEDYVWGPGRGITHQKKLTLTLEKQRDNEVNMEDQTENSAASTSSGDRSNPILGKPKLDSVSLIKFHPVLVGPAQILILLRAQTFNTLGHDFDF